jgi:hypothetical protein
VCIYCNLSVFSSSMAKHIKDKHQKEAAAEQEPRAECWANFTSPQATGKGRQTAAGGKRWRRYDREREAATNGAA